MRRRLRSAVLALACGVPSFLAAAPAQSEAAPCPDGDGPVPAAGISDFAWLEGTWRGEGPGGATAEIHYLAPQAGVLPSLFRLGTEDEVVVLEAITLVAEDGGLTLYIRHFTPALVPLEKGQALELELSAREGKRFVFQNVREQNPRCTVLERTGPDAFESRSRLLRDDGSVHEIRVRYRRVDG